MKLTHLFAVLFFILNSTSVAADEVRYYDIEIIVFESLDANAKLSETWPNEVVLETPPLVVDLGQPYPGPLPKEFDPKQTFRPTPSTQLQLLNEAKLLQESRNYRILLHTGWRQPGMEAETALPVLINQSYLVDELSNTLIANPNPATQSPVLTPTSTQNQTRSLLHGYVKVILSRYLHMDVKLVYTTKIPLAPQTVMPAIQPDDPAATPLMLPKPVVYYLEETRKMRSKEVHYLDHPVLGVVLLATPVETGR